MVLDKKVQSEKNNISFDIVKDNTMLVPDLWDVVFSSLENEQIVSMLKHRALNSMVWSHYLKRMNVTELEWETQTAKIRGFLLEHGASKWNPFLSPELVFNAKEGASPESRASPFLVEHRFPGGNDWFWFPFCHPYQDRIYVSTNEESEDDIWKARLIEINTNSHPSQAWCNQRIPDSESAVGFFKNSVLSVEDDVDCVFLISQGAAAFKTYRPVDGQLSALTQHYLPKADFESGCCVGNKTIQDIDNATRFVYSDGIFQTSKTPYLMDEPSVFWIDDTLYVTLTENTPQLWHSEDGKQLEVSLPLENNELELIAFGHDARCPELIFFLDFYSNTCLRLHMWNTAANTCNVLWKGTTTWGGSMLPYIQVNMFTGTVSWFDEGIVFEIHLY